jgi:uncharacterized protein (DUF58 family)
VIDERIVDVEIAWRTSALARGLATCAAVALAVAVGTSQWQLIAFAAPMLGLLASIRWQPPTPGVRVHAAPALLRCFETERVTLTVWADGGVAVVEPVPGLQVEQSVTDSGATELTVSAESWGRYPVRVRCVVAGRGGLLAGTAVVEAAEVFVFPIAPPQATPVPRTELLDRLGTHLTPHVGRGVEYGNIRTYVPGDQLRTVNWPVSARRGSLHVTERLSERAADVVVLVDTYDQPAGPATAATERTVRGAVQVVQTALRNGDRAGVVALGGQPRWLGADIGRRQFYRVLDAVLAAGGDYETTSGTLAPRAAMPSGAIVVAFSTLLDTDFALALIELCRRGHVVIAVDVLDGAPFEDEQDPLIHRMWAMQRSFMYRDMRTIGVDIVPWPDGQALDQVMQLVPDHRRVARR